ncbi:MAG: hypothetical protein BRC28_03985 [Nanohaloarchaea archaeon SW_4_43_9]|nr:MAG: hypothetical protein BRC28_03985 [Nanohaloarchaea archaeon SW_4_43_9]
MLISSIVIGFIVISAASTISGVQERSFESDDTRDTIEMIKNSAEEVDHSDRREVENFIKMVSSITGYQTTTERLQGQSCFNITLVSSKTEVNLNCSQTKSEYSGSSGDSDNSGDSDYFEGFEDGSVSDWYVPGSCNDLDTWEASTTSYEGSYSLQAAFNGDNNRCRNLDLSKTYDKTNYSFRAKVPDPSQDDIRFIFRKDGTTAFSFNFDDEVNDDIEIITDGDKCRPGTNQISDEWYYFEFSDPTWGDSVDYHIEDGSGNIVASGSCNGVADLGGVNQFQYRFASYENDNSGEAYIDNVKME